MVRAKMLVTEMEDNQVKLECLYDPELAEDKGFCKATPWGGICMGIDNPKALEQFSVGKAFYVDFNPVE